MKKDYSKPTVTASYVKPPKWNHDQKHVVKNAEIKETKEGYEVKGTIERKEEPTIGVDVSNLPDASVEVRTDEQGKLTTSLIPTYKHLTVQTKYLNVRATPSSKGYRIVVLRKNDMVTVTSYGSEWCEIVDPTNTRKRAFVMTKHVK